MDNEDLFPDNYELLEIVENSDVEKKDPENLSEDDKKSDLSLVRTTLREVLIATQDSIKEAIQLASIADDHKGYSAIAQLVNSFSNISDKLISMHKEESKPERSKSNQTDQNALPNITNVDKQIVFSGDPAEILRKLAMKEDDGI